ncbi:MAG: hypothetical protein NVSMB9_13350 [Isosphaeraceae bacterium]
MSENRPISELESEADPLKIDSASNIPARAHDAEAREIPKCGWYPFIKIRDASGETVGLSGLNLPE